MVTVMVVRRRDTVGSRPSRNCMTLINERPSDADRADMFTMRFCPNECGVIICQSKKRPLSEPNSTEGVRTVYTRHPECVKALMEL